MNKDIKDADNPMKNVQTHDWNKERLEKLKELMPDLFTNATLIHDEARSMNPAESENLIIEGENLNVLKLLSNSYREKVRCIYIDPPYNTGNDFVYSDKFNQDKKEYWEDAEVTENGFKLNYTLSKQEEFKKNEILFATDGEKETLICLDVIIANDTVEYFKTHIDQKFICLERALDTTKKVEHETLYGREI